MDINIAVNRTFEGLSTESLFSMALRVNKKRQFLFVSKLIAKHLAVHPSLALGTGTLLASLLMDHASFAPHPQAKKLARMIETGVPCRKTSIESLDFKTKLAKKTVFIGMAETATGLGHAVFHHFENAAYVHTTREEIIGQNPSFVFEEEHSHATSHKVYAPSEMLQEAETIVLIDDEISTGNTLVNLICALDDQFPGKDYKALSILDWRNAGQKQKLAQLALEREIKIDVLALMEGQFDLRHSESPDEAILEVLDGKGEAVLNRTVEMDALPYRSQTKQSYLPFTGRFGLTSSKHAEIGDWIENIAALTAGSAKPLVIGIGENMYLPLRFALALEGDPLVQTTTRSPIFASDTENYPIKEKQKFNLPDAIGVEQFIYNINELDIDKIYLLAESVIDESAWQPLIAYLEKKAPVEWISLTAAKRRDSVE